MTNANLHPSDHNSGFPSETWISYKIGGTL